MTASQQDLEVPQLDNPAEPARRTGPPPHLTGSMVRSIVLVLLILLVAPAVIATGDQLAVPVIALMVLAEIAIAVAAITYWLATVGAPSAWLARRLHLTPNGFLIGVSTAFIATAVVALAWFRHELNNLRSPLAQFDLRAASTATRLTGERHLMESLNRAGVRSMLLLGFMLVLSAVAVGAFRSAVLLTATMAITGIVVEFLKVSQPPPLPAIGTLDQYPTQWPGGHAAFQGSIALGIVLWWWAAGLPRPSLAAVVVVPVAVLVGYSRAFLGIHLLSEVLSGWLVAAMVASFVIVIDRLVVPRFSLPGPKRPWLVVVSGVTALIISAVAANYVHRIGDRGPRNFGGFSFQHGPRLDIPRFGNSTTPPQPFRLTSSTPSAVVADLPRYSETLLGEQVQPVSVVVVSNEQPLRDALHQDGWTDGTASTPDDIAPTFWRALTGGPDRNLFSPTFLDTRAPNAVLRRASTAGSSGRQVAQVWEFPLESASGCPVWAITAARDVGTKWTWPALYPEHHIGPAVDSERDALADALAGKGFVDLGRVQVTKPAHGTGPAGSYVTDGKVAVVRQVGCR